MKKLSKVNLFLICIAVVSVLFAIFAVFDGSSKPSFDEENHEERINDLEDTIKALRKNVALYEVEIARLDLEKEKLKNNLIQIIRDYEKSDSILANGTLDDNVDFLTDYLSKSDTKRE